MTTPIQKIVLGFISVWKYLIFKVKYGQRITLFLINSIRNGLYITLYNSGKCQIGRFLMSTGPLYIKVLDKGTLIIGNNVFFNHNCSITALNRITIGDNCIIANNVVIVDHDHNITQAGVSEGYITSPVIIENNVWIGANVTILKGSHIGKNSVIAAGAVVNTAVPEYELWGGIPAKKIKSLKD